MSILSLLLAIFVVVCYAMAATTFFEGEKIGDFSWYKWEDPVYTLQNLDKARGITATILALGLLELITSLFSLIHGLMCCCLRKWHQVGSNAPPYLLVIHGSIQVLPVSSRSIFAAR